ncbi:MAG: hypothetical protein K6A23_04735 [Butyrivibrio sp.]|nr:hypothetical protein [Butyrivibrio sp.]
MKKNLLSIIILALLVVNLAMSGFMLLSVMTTNSQTQKIIADIAAALQLEANGGTNGQGFSNSATGNVAAENIATMTIPSDGTDMTISLKKGEDGLDHYMAQTKVVISMDTSNEGYTKYSESMANMESLMSTKIQTIIASHTKEEIEADVETIKEEILEALQDMYGSNFIYAVDMSYIIA